MSLLSRHTKSILALFVLVFAISACQESGGDDPTQLQDNEGDNAGSINRGNGVATLSWTPPTTNEDIIGSTLTDLAGYKIYYGTSSGDYPNVVSVTNPGLTSYTIENLISNTYFFVITAYDYNGNESGHSNEASKTID